MLFKMAGTTNQLSWTLLWVSLGWQLLSIGAIPISDTLDFQYHHYGSSYLPNNRTTWTFTTDDDAYLLLSFLEIDIERFFDYITVGEGTTPSPESQVLKWSGERVDDELLYLSTGKSLWLTFQSDQTINLRGFSFKVERVTKSYKLPCSGSLKCGNQVCLTRHDFCDGLPNCADSLDERCSIEVPVTTQVNVRSSYSEANHGTNHMYTWLFVTDPGSRIQLTFDYISTELHYDFVTVGDGSVLSENLLLTFSGEQDGKSLSVTSSEESMWLTLSTDRKTLESKSFSANLTKIDGEGYSCDGDTFDCMNGVCLPSRYRCDKIAQCATGSDESDQICPESCPLTRMCMDGECFEEAKKCDEELHCLNLFDEHGCTLRKDLVNGHFKQTFYKHAREISFVAQAGMRVFLTFYLPQRETGNTTITVTRNPNSPYRLNGKPAPGFYRLISGSRDLNLIFSTDSEITIFALSVASGYKYCPDGFQCSDGLQCIPYELSCDGTEHCQDKSDERPELCGVEPAPECVMDSQEICEEDDTTTELENIQMGLQREDVTEKDVRNYADRLEAIADEAPVSTSENVDLIVTSLSAIVGKDETGVNSDSIISVVDDLYSAEVEAITGSSNIGAVSFLLEEQIGNVVSNDKEFSELTLENVRATAVEVDASLQVESVTYGTAFAAQTSREELTNLANFGPPDFISAGVATNVDTSHSITMPGSLLRRYSTGESMVPLTLISYKDGSVFPISSAVIKNFTTTIRKAISSQVISASIPNRVVTNLPDGERITAKFFSFPVENRCEKEMESQCVFWKYDEIAKRGEWSTEGCTTEKSNSEDRIVTCSCNHLTSFAVLVHLSEEPRIDMVVLDIITDIGCILSIIGLLICLVTIFVVKTLRGTLQFRVHANLCVALIAFYVTFFIGVDRTSNPLGCQITASLIHYFCLSSMAWMSVEAVLFYKMLTKTEQQDVNYLLPVGMVFAWGVPLLVALAVAFLDNSHDYECFTDYCFLHPGLGLYFGFLLLIALMFVFNTIVFFIVSYKFASRAILSGNQEKRKKEIAFRARGITLFWLLMGMSWAFGLLAAIIPSPIKIIFDLLFSLFMALQGFAMFYMLTFNNPKVKKLWDRLNCFGENMSLFSRSRSTTKTTQGSQKSGSNDQTAKSSSAETDAEG